MKRLLGLSYEELTAQLGLDAEKHYYSLDREDGFSVFVEGNEFLFNEDGLFSIEVSHFDPLRQIHGFNFPIVDGLEETLTELAERRICWEICEKYSRQHWVVIKLLDCEIRYEFEFSTDSFQLRYIRLEAD